MGRVCIVFVLGGDKFEVFERNFGVSIRGYIRVIGIYNKICMFLLWFIKRFMMWYLFFF